MFGRLKKFGGKKYTLWRVLGGTGVDLIPACRTSKEARLICKELGVVLLNPAKLTGDALKYIRVRMCRTPKQRADFFGVSSDYWNRMESGKADIPETIAFAMLSEAKRLGIPKYGSEVLREITPDDLRAFRSRHGLSVTDAAWILCYSSYMWYGWESGKTAIPPEIIYLLTKHESEKDRPK